MSSPLPPLSRLHTVAALVLGALAGFLAHPILWLPFWANPFSWLAYVLATAAQESGYNPTASGDDGDSVGLLQFNVATWPELTGLDLERRTSAILSGFYAAKYVETALLTSWRWWLIGTPVLGFAVMRWMWTHGTSAYSAERIFSGWEDGATALSAAGLESRSWSAYLWWSTLLAIPGIVFLRASSAALSRLRR